MHQGVTANQVLLIIETDIVHFGNAVRRVFDIGTTTLLVLPGTKRSQKKKVTHHAKRNSDSG